MGAFCRVCDIRKVEFLGIYCPNCYARLIGWETAIQISFLNMGCPEFLDYWEEGRGVEISGKMYKDMLRTEHME
jgi:hypothetical protein